MNALYKFKSINKRKTILVLFTISFLMSSFSSWAQPVGANMTNPIVMGTYGSGNYTYSDTKNNSTSNGYLNDNTVMQSDDIYYKFTIQTQAAVIISHCGSGISDSYMTLLNSSGGVITTNDDNGPACTGLAASISITLAAGTYYIISEGYGVTTGNITTSVTLAVQPPADSRNFIKIWDVTSPQTDPNNLLTAELAAVKQSVTYFDGLGKPDQSIIRKGSVSAAGKMDLVKPYFYDAYGREVQKYLPYAASTDDGTYKTNVSTEQNNFYLAAGGPVGGQGENYFYSKTDFESSPLNRTLKLYAAGNNWVGASRGVGMLYLSNTDIDDVKKWSVTDNQNGWGSYAMDGRYDAGQLYKNVTIDENSKQVIEFKDKDGRMILKKIQLTSTADDGSGKNYSGWLCTYYIYDDLNNLRCVIQPKGVEAILGNWVLDQNTLDELCFRNEYDKRNRVIMKKVPGADVVYMVYDNRNRLAMTQDGKLRAAGQWIYTQYDVLNRPIATGTWATSTTFSDHITAAALLPSTTVSNYPASGTAGLVELTHTYYDNYKWLADEGNPTANTRYAGDDSWFLAASSLAPYPEGMIQSSLTNGLVTGLKSKVLGTSQSLYNTNFYDDKSRVIQTISTNLTGGAVATTNQYSFSGQVLISYQTTGNNQTNQATGIGTKFVYDDLGRLQIIKKIVNTNFIAGVSEKTIVENSYDALGRMSSKTLAPAFNSGNGLEKLKYDYNIRGWLLGVNRNYVGATGQTYDGVHFGFELGYDKVTNSAGNAFNTAQWNGNVSGMVWKSDGDDVKRKYDFTYDATNRLIKADYQQDDATNTWNNSTMNFNIRVGDGADPLTAYDANGNIKRMQQWGWKLNGSSQIDNMDYSYLSNGNKLSAVTEQGAAAVDNKLGDFTDKNTVGNDYNYDLNGNLLSDKNKNISSISYNYLNLPEQITVDGMGTITYTYDAGGNKLKKTTVENAVSPTKTTVTTYIGNSVYENNVLQYIGQEEGRIRLDPTAGFAFDYFLKDHLGNVRLVLTEQQQTVKYPVASLESAKVGIEKSYYDIKEETDPNIVDRSVATGIANYTNDNGIGNNPTDATFSASNSSRLYKLNSGNAKTGLGVTLKVMAGDKIDVFGKSYYFQNTSGTAGNSPIPVIDLLTAFLGAPGAATTTAAHGTMSAAALNSIPFISGINSMVGQQNSQNNAAPNKPRAFINVIFFDEQFKSYDYRVSPVGSNSIVKDHYSELQSISANKSGYVYVYCSNESPVNVFFDNLQVVHTRGPILEETHYYPFGLTMAGISSKALNFGDPGNKKKFTSQELNADLDVNWYEFAFRTMDPQLGRFLQIDPLASKYVYNSTYAYAENRVVNSIDAEGLEAKLAIAGAGHEHTHYTKSDINAFNSRAQRLERVAGFVASQAQNGDQIINQMVQATKAEGSIGAIVTYAHSGSNGIYLDNNQGLYTESSNASGSAANIAEIKAKVDAGDIKFDKNAIWIFASCNTGNNEQIKNQEVTLAASAASNLGITTVGATGSVYPEIVNGKETGRLKTDGTFLQFQYSISTTTITSSQPIKFFGITIGHKKVTQTLETKKEVKQKDLGNTIDPVKLAKTI